MPSSKNYEILVKNGININQLNDYKRNCLFYEAS